MTLNRRKILAGIGALALPATLGTPARAAGEIGLSLTARGPAMLYRAGGVADLQPGFALFEADRVRTEENGFAALRLNTATQINLGPQSEVVIDSYLADLGGQITIGGAIAFDRPEDLPAIDLTVRTAFAQIGVRGTRFFAGPSKGVFAVFVDRGEVTVRSLGTTRTLRAGDGVEVVSAGTAPRAVVKWGQARIDAAFASVGL